MQKIGFDNEKYLAEQTKAILDRVAQFDHKLYLEFGGKLLFDYHASRVLPGYDPTVKMQLLQRLKDNIEIVICIYAKDIEAGRLRGDFGMTYDMACLKTIDDLKDWGLKVNKVVITRFKSEPLAIKFKNRLERKGINVYIHREIKGYPNEPAKIVSKRGYGRNDYIKTEKPIIVVTAPGPGSGKLATCLSQLYHDHKLGINSGYAKFETFPIWNIPLKHPVNVAYESATADLGDFNLVDPHHLKTYGRKAINYNRDVDAFPILKAILQKIVGKGKEMVMYNSPTDMGVNRAGFGIVDDAVVREAAKQEIVRRFFRYHWEFMLGLENKETVERARKLMEEAQAKEEDRACVLPAREAAKEASKTQGKGNNGVFCGAAIQLSDGKILSGKNSQLMHAASAAIINAIKYLAEIPDKIHLLPRNVISNIAGLKKEILGSKKESLDLEETLVALSISAATNPSAEAAVKALKQLNGCEMHMTHMPTPGDEAGLRKLRINFTCDAQPTSDYFLR
ncbi:MAG: DUF1846 domain-containing protein [Candidatus Omnitrophica bacterium]|nr:DUF1846 domain-containing protein [Candidatus Omnitrophota bacterium]